MEITPFKVDYLPEMAGLFIENFRALRAAVPSLPDTMTDSDRVAEMLTVLMDICPGIVALQGGKVAGYMGWFTTDDLRGTGRKGTYVPEWGHGALADAKPAIYRALYREAARLWTDIGCQVHALTLLAHDHEAEKVWFWNGFGLTVVDAIRPIDPLELSAPADFIVRKATLNDVERLRTMEVEHWGHYLAPPVLMDAYEPATVDDLAAFINTPQNSIWLALAGDTAMGYLRFNAHNEDSVAIVKASDQVAETGAFVRLAYRGRKVAPVLLDAALHDYADQGFKRCSVDFESFNPEAATFWPRYFTPVGLSVVRVPERHTPPTAG